MADQADLERFKQRLSGKLLAIDGVSGVGVGSGRIQIYLARDHQETRAAIDRLMQAEAPDIPHAYFVTGEFRADQ
jgi:hypothetical protein